MELISVIIPVYNTQIYLKKCVESFIKQTYRNLEIILIDDGSTDDSSKICDDLKKIDSRIRVIHKKNGGLSEARNVGISVARGELITFFDSDDFVENDYIEYLYNLKKKYKTQISVCGYNVADENGKVLFSIKGECEGSITKEEFYKKMLNEDGVTVSSCFKLYDISLLKDIKFPVGKICEDNGTTYKIIENSKSNIAYGNIAKGYYIIRKNSIMRSTFNIKKMDMIEFTDEMCDYLSKKYKNLDDIILRRRIYSRFNVLRQMDYKDESTKDLMNILIEYIYKYKKFILKNRNVPKRDKIACILLCINTRLFFVSWEVYRRIKYDK